MEEHRVMFALLLSVFWKAEGVSWVGMNESWKSHLLGSRVVLPHAEVRYREPTSMTERENGVYKDGALLQDGLGSPPSPNRTKVLGG